MAKDGSESPIKAERDSPTIIDVVGGNGEYKQPFVFHKTLPADNEWAATKVKESRSSRLCYATTSLDVVE